MSRGLILLGVPYTQDSRIGCTKCEACGGLNPPWGGANSFDENALLRRYSK